MNYKTRDSVKLLVIRKIQELNQEIKELEKFEINEDDLYIKTGWRDSKYPGSPNDELISKTIEEGISWLSKESHPMSFGGCTYHMGLYINLLEEPTLIKSYDAEKLARLKKNGMDYSYDDFT